MPSYLLRGEKMRLLAVDAAKVKSGWALFTEGYLTASGTVVHQHQQSLVSELPVITNSQYIKELVIEVPQVYGAGGVQGKGDPNHLIDCAVMVGRWIEVYLIYHPGIKITQYRPREWKKQTPKRINHQRAIEALTPLDRVELLKGPDCFTATSSYEKSTSKRLDQLDAIAIGLKHLGRTR